MYDKIHYKLKKKKKKSQMIKKSLCNIKKKKNLLAEIYILWEI